MRFSHLALAMPYQPGAISLSGKPFGCRQRRPVHLVAEDVVGTHGIFERHAAGEVLLELDVAYGVLEGDLAVIGPPEHHLDAVLEDACFFQDGRERRPGPARVADAAGEKREPMIAGAFDREDNLLSRPCFDVVEGQAQRLLDEPVDLELPGARVDDRPIEMRDRKELVVGRDPGIEILPNELLLNSDRIRIFRWLIEPGNNHLSRPAGICIGRRCAK